MLPGYLERGVALISNGFLVTQCMLHCLPTWTPIKRALRSGLLRFLAFSSTPCVLSKLGSTMADVIRSLLTHSLVGSLVVRQVFLSTRKAVAKHRTLAHYLEDGVMPSQLADSEVRDAWSTLFLTLGHHTRALELFSSERKCEEVACENVS